MQIYSDGDQTDRKRLVIFQQLLTSIFNIFYRRNVHTLIFVLFKVYCFELLLFTIMIHILAPS